MSEYRPETVDKTTWEALEREALHCPVLQRVVHLAREDRERAMIAGLLGLSRMHRADMAREVERLMHQPVTPFARRTP